MEQNIVNGTADQIWSQTNYFIDIQRKIDFILVAKVVQTRANMNKLNMFIKSLTDNGVQYETAVGINDRNLMYIKLHVPDQILLHYANIYNVILECFNKQDVVTVPKLKLFETILTAPDARDPIYQRARLSETVPKVITSAERTLVLNKILQRAIYSTDNSNDHGVEKLIKGGILMAAYPLHDSDPDWPNTGYISDTQLLRKYWAGMRFWYKRQPINLIYKYFGPEIAFYFVFVNLYIKMLIPAAVFGLVAFIANIVMWLLRDSGRKDDICESTIIICPSCLTETICAYRRLSDLCNSIIVTSIFDGVANAAFAIFMIFWSTIFMELWTRKQTELIYKWNLTNVPSDTETRQEYYEHTKYRKVCEFSGKIIPYIPTRIAIINYLITGICCLCMVFIIIIAVLLSIFYRLYISKLIKLTNLKTLKKNLAMFTMCTGALLSWGFIKIFSYFYMKLVVKLTNRENPRTLVEYHNSIIYKAYILSFVNNYFPLFYLAFMKEKLYSYPGDEYQYTTFLGILADVCPPTGCVFNVTVMLLFILGFKTSVARVVSSIIPFVKKIFIRNKNIKLTYDYIPIWEKNYMLGNRGELFMIKEYTGMAIQYGFVILFISALPLAPVLALINNIIEMRITAFKFLKQFKRPISRRLPGIGAWNIIFKIATYFGNITNAFVIAFSSDVIEKEVYAEKHRTLIGYINTTLSVFKTADFSFDTSSLTTDIGTVTECYYRGRRNPYNHTAKYEYADSHWLTLAYKLCFAVIFEQIVWVLTAVCAAAIPDVPESIKRDLRDDSINTKEIRLEALGKFMKGRKEDLQDMINE